MKTLKSYIKFPKLKSCQNTAFRYIRSYKFYEGKKMLRLALMFFVVALVAALFGFGGIAEASADIAKFVFFVFIALIAIAVVFGLADRRGPRL